MARRPAHTLLFIKSNLVARMDFGPLPELAPLGFWQQLHAANSRLYYSIEAALKLGGKCGRTVWVLGEGFWTQTLAMPATALAGLNREQIIKAIGFDVEVLTGLPGVDSALSFCKAAPPDESEHLWVTQVPLAARTQIQTVIEAAGSMLGGIIHPGGLPGPLDGGFDAGSSATWRRIEVWKDATLCLMGRGVEAQRLDIINGDPAQDVWRTNVTRWINSNDAGHSEWLGPQGTIAGESPDGVTGWLQLPELTGEPLKLWLARWTSKLAHGATNVPVIEPGRGSNMRRKHLIAATIITVACLAGCIGRGLWLRQQEAQLTEQRAQLAHETADKTAILESFEAPKRQWKDLQAQIKTLRAELEERKARRIHMAFHSMPDFELQRHRINELFIALAQNANPDLLIDRISPDGEGTMSVEGKCLSNTSIDTFTRELAKVLPAVGWVVSPAKRTPAGAIPAGQFSFRVIPFFQKNAEPPEDTAPASSLAGSMK